MSVSRENSKVVATGGKKRRRWPWTIGIIVVALAALVVVLPYLVSTGPGTRATLSIVNGQIKQKVHVDDLSLRWFGPTVIRGLRVSGPGGDEIAAVPTITWSGGLWKAIFSPYHFGNIDVDSPVITDDLGKPSQPPGPSQSSKGPLPDIIGDVQIKDGLVKIINSQGRLMRIEHTNGQVAIRTLTDIKGAITGTLDYTIDVSQQGNVITFQSGGPIDNFQLQSGDKPVTEKTIKIALNGTIDMDKWRATLDQAQIDSDLLSLQAKGTVDDLNGEQVLDIAGSYKTSWDKLIPLLRELYPAQMQNVTISGDSGSDFRMAGPIAQKDATPSWRDLKVSGFTLRWTGAQIYGIKTGPAALSPTISGGKIDLPTTDIPANNGKLVVGGTADMTGKDPLYELASQVQVLEKIEITPELKDALLTRLNPIFTHVATISGSVTLQASGVTLPLSDAIKHQGSGQGHLDLTDLKIGPAGDFAKVFEFMGVGDPSSVRLVKVNGVDFKIHDGKISYDNFAMDMGVFDMVFSGTIGFDDSMEMSVSLPLNKHFLQMLQVPGPIADSLNGMRVPIPLVGTRTNFRIAFDKIDLKPLIANATNLPKQGIQGLQNLPNKGVEGLGNLIGDKPKPKDQPTSQPTSGPSPSQKIQPKNPLDEIKGMLK